MAVVTSAARVLRDEDGRFPEDLARSIPNAGFSDKDKPGMRELAVNNQEDGLTPAELAESRAFARAGDLLAIWISKARRALGIPVGSRSES